MLLSSQALELRWSRKSQRASNDWSKTRHMWSFFVSKSSTDQPLLQGRDVEDTDVFHFNSGFTAQLFRVKINTIQMKESAEENKKTNDQVMQDRQYQVRTLMLPPPGRGLLSFSLSAARIYSSFDFAHDAATSIHCVPLTAHPRPSTCGVSNSQTYFS